MIRDSAYAAGFHSVLTRDAAHECPKPVLKFPTMMGARFLVLKT